MKKITFTFILSILLICPIFTKAQVMVNYDTSFGQSSFVNAFDIGTPPSPGDASFGYNPAFTSVIAGTNIEIIPNTEIWTANNGSNPGFNTFWFEAQDVPRKTLEVLTYTEYNTTTNPSIFNTELTFSADLSSYDLVGAYTVKLFITIFEAGFSNFRKETFTVPNTTGATYSVTFPAANVSAADEIIQYGFQLEGPMADPAASGLGSADFAQTVLSINKFDVTEISIAPNPSNNVWNIKGQETINDVKVFDVLGKQVMSVKPNSTEVELNASALPKGLYFAKMTTELGTGSIKLIKN